MLPTEGHTVRRERWRSRWRSRSGQPCAILENLVDDERKRELKREAREVEKAAAQQAMLLDEDSLNELLDHLDASSVEVRCDRSLRVTGAWAAERGIDPNALCSSLRQFGGHCDCEVLANAGPDAIF